MAYTALYRKFRPVSFDDVKGQDHIVTTLRNQIKADRLGHAYLFCGTRGTGKTTVAKILARSVNCESPVDGSPCGQCPTCKAIADGGALNIIEIDAASNTGVDNVREIIDEVAYSPTLGRFKVYIIDEVHMLSSGAFNALLKTLEEPPEYVIFILATTEPHKLPITILSRCQRYDFHRITIETIQARLKTVCEEEKLSVEEKALHYIAKCGDGSMRDALSLLDQCVAFHYGETLTYDLALEVLGAVDTGVFNRLINAVYDGDVVGAVNILQEVTEQGRELTQFNNDLIWYVRSLMLAKTDTALEEVIDINTEDMEALKASAARMDMDSIMRYIRELSELTSRLRYSPQKRILLEVALIRLCHPEMTGTSGDESTRQVIAPVPVAAGESTDVRPQAPAINATYELALDDLKFRLSALEEKIESGIKVSTEDKPRKVPPKPKALPKDVMRVNSEWGDIIRILGDPYESYLAIARRSVTSDGKLELVWGGEGNYFAYTSINTPEVKQSLEDAIADRIDKQVDFILTYVEDKKEVEENYYDISQLLPDTEIDTEESNADGYI
ncbi:MAG: DNA polymerase III subunit gamma/tau [Lachnospiraceae bacterium]|nr:DNA polymerase III subunit gamma/tau [Lachnospiraceae bacterium]